MRKILLIIAVALISTVTFAQMPLSWAITLPADYLENKPDRDTILVSLVVDADVTGANSLEDVWGTVGTDYQKAFAGFHNKTVEDKTTGDTITLELPTPSAEDFSASMAVMAGTDALYWLFNVKDDEPGNAEESKMEFIYASYADAYDVSDRTIIPDKSGWWFDAANNSYATWMAAGGDTAVIDDMARYGLWDETGAKKIEVPVQTLAESYGGTMYFHSRGDTISGNADFGTTTVALTTVYEATTDGYLFLIIMPWALTNDVKLAADGDMMSLSAKLKDFDADNIEYTALDGTVTRPTYEYWAGTENNNVFWAVAYYGMVAKVKEVDNTSVKMSSIDNRVYIAYDQLNIVGERVSKMEMFDISGKLILNVKNPSNSINIGDLNKGIYIAKITGMNGNVSAYKVLKSN